MDLEMAEDINEAKSMVDRIGSNVGLRGQKSVEKCQ